MQIGTLFFHKVNIIEIKKKNNNYIKITDNTFEDPITELQIAYMLNFDWNIEDKVIRTEKEDDIYKSKLIIFMEDDLEFHFYGYGETEELALIDLHRKKEYFDTIYNQYIENVKRNRNIFFKKVQKFAFINNEFYYFEKTNESFKEVLLKQGITDENEINNMILGYLQDNKIIIFKSLNDKRYRKEFVEFVKTHHKEIANYYKLDKYQVYYDVLTYDDVYTDNFGNLTEELLTEDYDIFTPINYIGQFKGCNP